MAQAVGVGSLMIIQVIADMLVAFFSTKRYGILKALLATLVAAIIGFIAISYLHDKPCYSDNPQKQEQCKAIYNNSADSRI